MSRRFHPSQRPRGSTTFDNNQIAVAGVHNYIKNGSYAKQPNGKCAKSYKSEALEGNDTCFSDDTFADTNTYYEYYNVDSKVEGRRVPEVEYYSEDSDSTRLPYYEYESLSLKRHSRNTNGSYEREHYPRSSKLNPAIKPKDARRVYPNQEVFCDRFCSENARYVLDIPQTANVIPKRPQVVGLSERCTSSQNSDVTSVIVDGCGGHCQTFENVCYYFLQVAFTMGILIGTSLSLAGALLRKSAARNLQVLVYIGALLSLVSALLLGVQRNARKNARKRKQALRNSKRAPIQMDVLPNSNRANPAQLQQQQQPLMHLENAQRTVPSAVVAVSMDLLGHPNANAPPIDQSGVPWWRRKDLA